MVVERIGEFLAICETKARYCRCLDIKDWDGFKDVFLPDLEIDTTASGGYEVRGRDDAVKMVRNSVGDAITVHQVHSPEIEFIDDSTADAVFAMQDRIIWSNAKAEQVGFQGLTGWGHYHERYVRAEDGMWRIATQRLTRLHMDMQPLAEQAR